MAALWYLKRGGRGEPILRRKQPTGLKGSVGLIGENGLQRGKVAAVQGGESEDSSKVMGLPRSDATRATLVQTATISVGGVSPKGD